MVNFHTRCTQNTSFLGCGIGQQHLLKGMDVEHKLSSVYINYCLLNNFNQDTW